MAPESGASKPAMSLRHVVLPEPDGPSIAKNSPSAIVSETQSTARTLPNVRTVSRSSIALSATYDGHIIRGPLAVRHTGSLLALRFRRAPEPDLVEVIDAVGFAAVGPEQRMILTSGGHRRH